MYDETASALKAYIYAFKSFQREILSLKLLPIPYRTTMHYLTMGGLGIEWSPQILLVCKREKFLLTVLAKVFSTFIFFGKTLSSKATFSVFITYIFYKDGEMNP